QIPGKSENRPKDDPPDEKHGQAVSIPPVGEPEKKSPPDKTTSPPTGVKPSNSHAAKETVKPLSEETNSEAGGEPKWRVGAPEIPEAGETIPAPSSDLFVDDPLSGKSLDELEAIIKGCDKCGLCTERTQAVPGEGPADARLMVVGEGPGAKEDETGRPFVGRAGELLSDILSAIDFPREKVYIGNVVKCRPPGNRTPERTEIEQCLPYLMRQISLVKPDVILAMGTTAAGTLLDVRSSLGSMRNKVHSFHGIPLVVTYHPAALLRNPNWKKPTWDDVRIARRLLAGER
ncbi:MAG: uracil-DNA glycosylase, partial [Gemmatimonadota bacterium]|nr:uracil-DNA glycosylase [Gemmatimonadota bacterium]